MDILDNLGMSALPLRFLTPVTRRFSRRCGTPQRLGFGIRQPARFPHRLFGGGSCAFPLPTVAWLPASPSRTPSCDQKGHPPWNPRCFAAANQQTHLQSRNRARSVVHGLPCLNPSPWRLRIVHTCFSAEGMRRGSFLVPSTSQNEVFVWLTIRR